MINIEIEEPVRMCLKEDRIRKGPGKISILNLTPPLSNPEMKGDSMNIYVGNLSQEVTEGYLREAFEAFGQVTSAKIITDKFTGQSKGFGFVEMPNKTEAGSAISGLNGKDLKGQSIKVNEAYPRRDDRNRRSGFGGRRRY